MKIGCAQWPPGSRSATAAACTCSSPTTRARDTPRSCCQELASRGLTIDALVNNAGYGVPGNFVASPWERHEDMLQVMVVGWRELTHRLLPGMIERGYGRIINVASLAGLVPAPAGHTLYAAAKALVIKFSEALSHEVRAHDVHVTAVCPGFTHQRVPRRHRHARADEQAAVVDVDGCTDGGASGIRGRDGGHARSTSTAASIDRSHCSSATSSTLSCGPGGSSGAPIERPDSYSSGVEDGVASPG